MSKFKSDNYMYWDFSNGSCRSVYFYRDGPNWPIDSDGQKVSDQPEEGSSAEEQCEKGTLPRYSKDETVEITSSTKQVPVSVLAKMLGDWCGAETYISTKRLYGSWEVPDFPIRVGDIEDQIGFIIAAKS